MSRRASTALFPEAPQSAGPINAHGECVMGSVGPRFRRPGQWGTRSPTGARTSAALPPLAPRGESDLVSRRAATWLGTNTRASPSPGLNSPAPALEKVCLVRLYGPKALRACSRDLPSRSSDLLLTVPGSLHQ
jgi:hypothetical protein